MKFFKKRGVAVILAIIIVIAATLISVNVKFGAECRDITNGFYYGVYYNNEYQPAIYDRLTKISGSIEKVIAIAQEHGLDTENAVDQLDYLDMGYEYSGDEISYLFYCYEDVMDAYAELRLSLSSAELNDEEKVVLNNCYKSIEAEQNGIKSSGYNESVREFLSENDRFPVNILADFAGVYFPEYFS